MYKKVIGFLMLWLASSAQATVVLRSQFEFFDGIPTHASEYLDFNLDGAVDEFGYQVSCRKFSGFAGGWISQVGFNAKATQATGELIFRMPMANYTFTFAGDQCSKAIEVSVARATNRLARPVLVIGLRVGDLVKIMLASTTGQPITNNGQPVVLDTFYSDNRYLQRISVGEYIRNSTGDELRIRSATDGGHFYDYYDLNTLARIRRNQVFQP